MKTVFRISNISERIDKIKSLVYAKNWDKIKEESYEVISFDVFGKKSVIKQQKDISHEDLSDFVCLYMDSTAVISCCNGNHFETLQLKY